MTKFKKALRIAIAVLAITGVIYGVVSSVNTSVVVACSEPC